MALISVNKIDTNKYSMEISVPSEPFVKEVNKIFRKNSKDIAIPGFRKGKAPLSIIEKMYGESVFFDDAINNLYPEAYKEAVKGEKLEVVDTEKVEVVSASKNDGFVFKVEFVTTPEVEIDNYKGLEATKKVLSVTESDIESEIEKLRRQYSRTIDITDRAAELNDEVVIDFEGMLDGIPFEGGKGDGYKLVLGSGQFIPGFEDQIVGHNIDEEFEINVKFPSEYHSKELAGKDSTFKITIHSITATELPELDDEFVKDISEFDTLEELKCDLEKSIQASKDARAEEDIENQLVDALVSNMKADVPRVMIDKKIDELVANFENNLKQQGIDLQTYLAYIKESEKNFKTKFEQEAQKSVKLRLALKKIAELENLTMDESEFDNKIKELSERYQVAKEKILSVFDREILESDIVMEKAINLIKDAAKITETEDIQS